jgi:hypothetical protein
MANNIKGCRCFIRLTNVAINTLSIRKIEIQPNKYVIHTTSMGDFSGFSLMGSGYCSTDSDGSWHINKHINNADYHIVETWLSKIE